jgi:hypothetical protein
LLVDIDVLTPVSAASTLEEEFDRLLELVFIVARRASTLDDDDETLKDDAWKVEIELFAALSAASTLLELDESDKLDVRNVEMVVFV